MCARPLGSLRVHRDGKGGTLLGFSQAPEESGLGSQGLPLDTRAQQAQFPSPRVWVQAKGRRDREQLEIYSSGQGETFQKQQADALGVAAGLLKVFGGQGDGRGKISEKLLPRGVGRGVFGVPSLWVLTRPLLP